MVFKGSRCISEDSFQRMITAMEHAWQIYIPSVFMGLLLNVKYVGQNCSDTRLCSQQKILTFSFICGLFGQRNTPCAITEQVILIAGSTRQSCEFRTLYFTHSHNASNVGIYISVRKAQLHQELFIKKKNKEEYSELS